MKSKKGFTLVELLVVMAIISILAAIAVPNIIGRIESARVTRAISEIGNIELALTSMMADAGIGNASYLFDGDNVHRYIFNLQPGQQTVAQMLTPDLFARAQELYTRVIYAMLREGRAVISDQDTQLRLADGTFLPYQFVLNNNFVRKLGLNYMNELALDPWGQNLYQIYPGPWPAPRNPNGGLIPFRIYDIEDAASNLPGSRAGGNPDMLTLNVLDPDTAENRPHGYAAPRNNKFFIYSYGANLVSSQAIYRQDYTAFPQEQWYPAQEDPILIGGGDDINSWDSSGSWSRFYN